MGEREKEERERGRKREKEGGREKERISGFEVFDYVQILGLFLAGYVPLDNLVQPHDFPSTNMGVDTTHLAGLL